MFDDTFSLSQLAVFAELADAATGHVVWADSFKGAVSKLLAAEMSTLQVVWLRYGTFTLIMLALVWRVWPSST